MTSTKQTLTNLDEIRTLLGRNKAKVAEITGLSPTHVARVLNGYSNCSDKSIETVIAAAISIINRNLGIEEKQSSVVEEQSKFIDSSIESIINETAKRTAKEMADALGFNAPLITRRDAISQYFDNKPTRYEKYMDTHKGEVSISKGKGSNSTIYLNRNELEASFRKHKIYC